MRRFSLLLLVSLLAFVAPALAKPSDWADVIEKPGDRAALPAARDNAPLVVTKASASKPTKAPAAKKAKATKTKAKAKAKKAPRRGKAKQSRR